MKDKEDLLERVSEQREEIISRVMKLMDWDRFKSHMWYETVNPLFGGCSPEQLVHCDRAHKVLKFIKQAEDDACQPLPTGTAEAMCAAIEMLPDGKTLGKSLSRAFVYYNEKVLDASTLAPAWEEAIRLWAKDPEKYNIDCLEVIRSLLIEIDMLRSKK